MKKFTGSTDIERYEHLIDNENLQVTHLKFMKGEVLETHDHPWDVVVVIYKGQIEFTGSNGTENIVPGDIIRLEKGEPHKLVALDDADLMVVKSKLA